MERKDILRLLGDEVAQNDKNFLRYAIERKDLLDEVSNPEEKLIIINAPRGSGKSGLLLSLGDRLKGSTNDNTIVLPIFFHDLAFPENISSESQFINYWKNTILSEIVFAIGERKTFFARDDDIALAEAMEAIGEKEKNVVSSVLDRLKFKGSPIEKTRSDPKLHLPMLNRLINRSKFTFWVLLDEMDDHYKDNDEVNFRLIGLLQACQAINRMTERVIIRLTIRPHILTILKGKFDVVQKFHQRTIAVTWSPDEFVRLLAKRVETYTGQKDNFALELFPGKLSNRKKKELERNKLEAVIDQFFEDFDLSFKKEKGSNYRALHTASLGKPRWLVGLCFEALKKAPGDRADRLAFQKAMYDYGHERINFLAGEHYEHFPKLKAVTNALAALHRADLGSTDELRVLLMDEVVKKGVDSPDAEFDKDVKESIYSDHALSIAQKLFQIEFIRARQDAGGRKRNHRFFSWRERPELLSSWHRHPRMSWQIHPTFLRGLNVIDSGLYKTADQIKTFGQR